MGISDSKPTAELSPEIIKELSPEIIKTICDAISQEFYSWEVNEENDSKSKMVFGLSYTNKVSFLSILSFWKGDIVRVHFLLQVAG